VPALTATRVRLALLAIVSATILWFGWAHFWFMTDDAFITFRYISNAQLGYGYVWNPPPFQPVEGYTSFFRLTLLNAVWRVLGVEPPAAANWLWFFASLVQLSVVGLVAWRSTGLAGSESQRWFVLLVTLIGSLSNRTFLTWTSGGLETALFQALWWGWILCVSCRPASILAMSLAVATSLARPDGLLLVPATACLRWLQRPAGGLARAALRLAAPLLVLFVHTAWRVSFYGDWLPNTFRAKSVGAWPEAGVCYLASFALEYGLLVWLPVVIWVATLEHADRSEHEGDRHHRNAAARLLHRDDRWRSFRVSGLCAVGTGNLPLVLGWSLASLRARWRFRVALAALVIGASLPIGWTHHALTKARTTRKQTFAMIVPVEPHFPAWLGWYTKSFDQLQAWLIERSVCRRHQEHKVFSEFFQARFPPRREGVKISAEGFPVIALSAVGIPAWTLPHVAIIDRNRLNDRVIGSLPPPPGMKRAMAHDRVPPPGYTDCFRPNVRVEAGRVEITVRAEPLTETQIIACETRL
jgi:arabinofuranosyltransferase